MRAPPQDRFVSFLFLGTVLHIALIAIVVWFFRKTKIEEITLAAGAIQLEEVNWVEQIPPEMLAQATLAEQLPPSILAAAEEPESDISLARPEIPKPKPEPKKLEPIPPKPEPKPEPPKPNPKVQAVARLTPVPSPKPQPKPVPKLTKVEPKPVPKPKPAPPKLTPAPKPKPKTVPKLTEVPKPAPKPTLAKTKPAPRPTPTKAATKPKTQTTTRPSNVAKSGSRSGKGTSTSGAGSSRAPSGSLADYHALVFQAFNQNWRQPHGITTAGNKYVVKTSITISRSGRIVEAKVIKSSQHSEMDGSVARALHEVTQIAPLPDFVTGSTYTVVLNFEL